MQNFRSPTWRQSYRKKNFTLPALISLDLSQKLKQSIQLKLSQSQLTRTQNYKATNVTLPVLTSVGLTIQ